MLSIVQVLTLIPRNAEYTGINLRWATQIVVCISPFSVQVLYPVDACDLFLCIELSREIYQ